MASSGWHKRTNWQLTFATEWDVDALARLQSVHFSPQQNWYKNFVTDLYKRCHTVSARLSDKQALLIWTLVWGNRNQLKDRPDLVRHALDVVGKHDQNREAMELQLLTEECDADGKDQRRDATNTPDHEVPHGGTTD
jgi:hypothetical protein